MKTTELDMVTGAFSYTGKYITKRLLSEGKRVRVLTLTGHPNGEKLFSGEVTALPFNFDNPSQLTESLQGVTTLYNSYWIRFPYGQVTFNGAVENTRTLIECAEEAGVRRIVHISITNASEESPFPYFREKGLLEKIIIHSKLSYAIIRPTVIFGTEGILINNIAWHIRKLPIFTVPGSGDYRVQPVFVEDLAEIVVNAAQVDDNIVIDAVGPDIYTFDELVRLISGKIRRRVWIVHLMPRLVLLLTKLLGYTLRDVVLTRDEIAGLMSSLIISEGSPTAKTRLSEWLEQNADNVGVKYASELERHYR